MNFASPRALLSLLSLRNGLAVAVVLLIMAPYYLLLGRIQGWSKLPWSEWGPVLFFTFVQALLSALSSLLLGFVAALGLLAKRNGFWWAVYLLPNVVPVLFVLTGALNLLHPFPFGLGGIVLVHTLLNLGLVAVMIREVLLAKVGGMAELAWTEGASKWRFIWIILPYLKRDLFWAFALVFALCFTSFTVPLVIGGYQGSTLEVLIYEKVVQEGAWSQAFLLSVLQMALLLVMTLALKGRVTARAVQRQTSPFLAEKNVRGLPLLASLTVVMGCVWGLAKGYEQFHQLPGLAEVLLTAVRGTLQVSLGVGFVSLGLLILLAYVLPHVLLRSWLLGYVAPSAVVLGFSFLGWASGAKIAAVLATNVGLALLFLPSLLRMGWMTMLQSLERQKTVAEALGASRALIFRWVVWPQIWPFSCFLAGLAALWASGDIAISGILLGGQNTLALVVESLLGSYRIELATLVVWLLMGCGGFVLALFWSLRYVADPRSQN